MTSGAIGFMWKLAHMGGIRVTALMLSFVLALVLARALGVEGYGYYTFTLTIFMILEPLAGGGLGTLATRDVATHDKPTQSAGVEVARILFSSICMAIVVAGLVVIIAWLFGLLNAGTKTQYLLWGLVLLPVGILVETTSGILAGQLKIRMSQFLTQVTRTLIPIVLVGSIWLYVGTESRLSPDIAFAAMGLSGFIVGGVALWVNRRPISIKFREVMEYRAVGILLQAALPFAFLTAFRYLNTRMDILMVGALMTAVDVGYYQVAVRLGHFVAIPASLVGLMLAPRFAKLYQNNNRRQLQRLFWLGQIPAITLSLAIASLILIGGHPFIDLAFGAEFLPATQPLTIIAIGQAFICFNALSAQMLVMTRREKKIVMVITVTSIGNFALNLWLIPIYGINGAAIATTTMSVLTVALITLTVYRSGILRQSQ